LFHGWNVPESVLEETTPLEEFQAAQAAGLLWVAVSPQHHPVGFALVEREGNRLHLEELDVHPLHGRLGIGSALVEAVCTWAQGHGYVEITLTTYRDVPWNRPFYARFGFEVLGTAELTAGLRERVEAEAVRGLDPACRVVMRKVLGTG
jgi:GNAT superfamily N-acetyltransferase